MTASCSTIPKVSSSFDWPYSVMLNKILSEYLDVETPEAQMERMFLKMEQFIGAVSGLRFINNASLAMAQVQSALHYRYNPTLRYQVELFPAGVHFDI